MEIRKSRAEDLLGIQRLVRECFGILTDERELLSNIENRYTLGIVDNEIVCMSGLSRNSDGALEIDWTCTKAQEKRVNARNI